MPSDLMPRPANPPEVAEKKRVPEGAIPGAFRRVRRDRHLSVPLAVPPAMWITGELLHHAGIAGAAATGGAAAAASVAVWLLAARKWDRPREQWYARLAVIAAGAQLTATAACGASGGTSGEVLGGTLLAGSIAWGIPWWQHKRPRGMRRRQKLIAKWEAFWQGHCAAWNLTGSRVIDAAESGVTVRIRVQLWAGRQSFQTVESAKPLIESGLQGIVGVGMVRVEVVKANPSQVDLFFKRENPLAVEVAWNPELAPRSVHETAATWLAETGQWHCVPQRVSSFVLGRTRSGKSNDLLLRVAQLSGCEDGRQVVIDLKGGRSAQPLIRASAVDYVITEVDEARAYLQMLVAEILARAKHCYTGDEQLLATREVPAFHTLIDEVHGLTSITSGDAECAALLAKVASQGAGLELYVNVYTQYGSLEESVRTEQTRSNLPLRVVYAVEEARHGQFAIPDFHKHDASKLEEKGTCLVKLGPKAHAEQMRAPKMTHELVKSITAANARRKDGASPWFLYCGGEPSGIGGLTWQEWWDARWSRLDPAFRKHSPQYQAAAASPEDAGQILKDASDAIESVPSAPGDGDGSSVAARIEAELLDVPDDYSPDRRTASRLGEVLSAQIEAFSDALAGAAGGISPAQLHEESGRGRTWVHQMLAALVESGAVTQRKRGLYAPVPGADIRGAITAVEDGKDALLRQARKQVRRGLKSVS